MTPTPHHVSVELDDEWVPRFHVTCPHDPRSHDRDCKMYDEGELIQECGLAHWIYHAGTEGVALDIGNRISIPVGGFNGSVQWPPNGDWPELTVREDRT